MWSSVAVHMAYVTIYLLSVSCLDKLVHTYSHLPPVCVPGEIIDWGDLCLTEAVDHTSLSCELVKRDTQYHSGMKYVSQTFSLKPACFNLFS